MKWIWLWFTTLQVSPVLGTSLPNEESSLNDVPKDQGSLFPVHSVHSNDEFKSTGLFNREEFIHWNESIHWNERDLEHEHSWSHSFIFEDDRQFNFCFNHRVNTPEERWRHWQAIMRMHFPKHKKRKRARLNTLLRSDIPIVMESMDPYILDQVNQDIERLDLHFFDPALVYPHIATTSSLPLETMKNDVKEILLTYLHSQYNVVGYAQTMASILVQLYLALGHDKDRSLRVFLVLLDLYHVNGLLDSKLTLTKAKSHTLNTLIKAHLPKLMDTLQSLDPDLSLNDWGQLPQVTTMWWLHSLFTNDRNIFPEIRIQILSGFLRHGYPMLYAFALAQLEALEPFLIATDDDRGSVLGMLSHAGLSTYKLSRDQGGWTQRQIFNGAMVYLDRILTQPSSKLKTISDNIIRWSDQVDEFFS